MFYLQTEVSITAASRHLQKFVSHSAARDKDFLIKTALTEAFGGPVLRPWAVHAFKGGVATVVAYGTTAPDEANRRRSLSLPALQVAVSEVIGVPLPDLKQDEHLAFTVRLCPTIRVTPRDGRRHGERDAYLVAADEAGPNGKLSREEVYADYLRRRVIGAELEQISMSGFRINRMVRRSDKGQTGFASRSVPEAEMRGVLTVTDTSTLKATLASGIGRQRGFGHGMIRLQPLSA